MPTPLTVLVQADTSGLDSALGKSSGGFEVFGQKVNAGMALAGGAVVAGAAVAVAAIADWTNAAAEDRAEQEKLVSAYERLGISQDAATAAIDRAIEAGAAKAYSDSEVRAGLDALITATGDADKANELLAIAMDVAAKTGVPLEQASNAIAKAHAGQDAALRKLFPGMEKQKNAADTLTEATRLSTGAADEYAASSEGMGKKGSQAFDEMTEALGSAFLPILDELLPALIPIITILGELIKELVPALKPAIMLAVQGLRIFIDVLMTVLGWVRQVIDAVKSVINWVGQMVDMAQNAVGQVQGAIDAINPFGAPGGPGGAPVTGMAELGATAFGAAPRAATAGGGPTVNVHVQSADPEQVVRALRRWAAGNGGANTLLRSMNRQTGA